MVFNLQQLTEMFLSSNCYVATSLEGQYILKPYGRLADNDITGENKRLHLYTDGIVTIYYGINEITVEKNIEDTAFILTITTQQYENSYPLQQRVIIPRSVNEVSICIFIEEEIVYSGWCSNGEIGNITDLGVQ